MRNTRQRQRYEENKIEARTDIDMSFLHKGDSIEVYALTEAEYLQGVTREYMEQQNALVNIKRSKYDDLLLEGFECSCLHEFGNEWDHLWEAKEDEPWSHH